MTLLFFSLRSLFFSQRESFVHKESLYFFGDSEELAHEGGLVIRLQILFSVLVTAPVADTDDDKLVCPPRPGRGFGSYMHNSFVRFKNDFFHFDGDFVSSLTSFSEAVILSLSAASASSFFYAQRRGNFPRNGT